ncbi:hypothetical protein PIB30_019726 [Stylosanthes scabra]|uniref:FAF domain-containing protein n=1 Tax=Stylosanthes scabra TaxID=79078 RepID=A0ABU6VAP8_9FABA|nr:hypothetical protein [Stylosanthes scabra]
MGDREEVNESNVGPGTNKNHLHHHHSTAPSSPGLGLLTTLTKHDDQDSKLPNLVESSSSMLNSPSTANGLLFIDGGDEDDNGITSCTESLGFESSNESRIVYDHQQEQEIIHNNNMNRKERRRGGRKAASVRSFPPPLTSLTRNGQPSFFLRPVRKDGRLELTQVRIQRQDILHAWRQDGRLRLHLIPDRTLFEEEQEQAAYERHQQQDQEENDDDELEQVHDEHEHEEEVIGYGKDNNNNQWSSRYGNEYEGGLKRCYQMVNMDINMNMNHHHHHHHHGHHHMQMCGISIV